MSDRVEELLVSSLIELSSRLSGSVHSLASVTWSGGSELVLLLSELVLLGLSELVLVVSSGCGLVLIVIILLIIWLLLLLLIILGGDASDEKGGDDEGLHN